MNIVLKNIEESGRFKNKNEVIELKLLIRNIKHWLTVNMIFKS